MALSMASTAGETQKTTGFLSACEIAFYFLLFVNENCVH